MAGITTRWSRSAASRASRACASEPPTSASGSTFRTVSRNAVIVVKASADAGAASTTADSCTRSPSEDGWPGVTETTPGVDSTAAFSSSARSALPMTRVGLDSPAGKCAARVS
jgi:hypothetical protein